MHDDTGSDKARDRRVDQPYIYTSVKNELSIPERERGRVTHRSVGGETQTSS
jgi:hypothetical protein